MAPPLDTDTRDRLIRAAVEVFASRSYGDVATRDLAKAAGATLSAIGYHFGTKLDLYLAAANRVVDEMAEPLAACIDRYPLSAADPGGALESYMDEVAGIFLTAGQDVLVGSRFSLRELSVDGPARPMITARIVDPLVGHAAALLAQAGGDTTVDAAITARATTLFGPITLHRLLNNHALIDVDDADAAAACEAVRATIRLYVRALVAGS